MKDSTRKHLTIGYFANCIVQEGLAKEKSLESIRAELLYVCEVSTILNQKDLETIMDVGLGYKCI